jgi:hypothetical protein
MTPEELENKIQELENKIRTLEANYTKHQHDSLDGTNTLKKSIKLDVDQYLNVGLGSLNCSPLRFAGTTDERVEFAIGVGKEDGKTGFVNKADIAQVTLYQQPKSSTKFATLLGISGMIVSGFESSSVSVSAGGNTVTINGFGFVTDELAGSIINIYNSSLAYIETQTIASNTATEITISGTWSATTNGGKFFIYNPLYLGKSDYSYERLYVMGEETGGIRFGTGPTNAGSKQNGLLYMDSAGDLQWRNKAGTVTKLN